MQTDLGIFTSQQGQNFHAFWNRETGRVYMRLEQSSFRTSFVELGSAQTKEWAHAKVLEKLGDQLIAWQ